jgi:pyruvate ferredoxin oxidoreductase beta subunit/2-oxoisovalerate ferredoxin oxidoreductase beta subunit
MREPSKSTVDVLGAGDAGPSGGHLACQGCGGALNLRLGLKVLGEDCVFVIPACCMAVIDGPFPVSSLGVPLFHIAFEAAASAAAGIRAGFAAQGNDRTVVVAWAGDGATFDIGLGAVSASADRNDDYLYVCYDNEAYMNTGIQRSGATPQGAWTTTTPRKAPKPSMKKDIISILAAHRIPYIATASPSHPEDLLRKFTRAKETRGFRFLHLFSPCPPGQQFEEKNAIRIARKAVTSRTFPLLEVENGERLILTDVPDPTPVREYIELQGRFRHFTDQQAEAFEEDVARRWREYQEWAKRSSQPS